MANYYYETEGFALSHEGIHLLRSRYNYETIPFNQIDSTQIKKDRTLNNWFIVFAIGIGCVLFAVFYTSTLFSSLEDGYAGTITIYIEQILLPFLPFALGLYMIIGSFRKGAIMLIKYGRKTKRLVLQDLHNQGYLDDFIYNLNLELSKVGKKQIETTL